MYTNTQIDFDLYLREPLKNPELVNSLTKQTEYKNFKEINFNSRCNWFTFGIIINPPKVIKSNFGNGYLFVTLLCLLSLKRIPIFIDMGKKVKCCKMYDEDNFKLFDLLAIFNPLLLSPGSIDGGSIALKLKNNNLAKSKSINFNKLEESFINLGLSKGYKFCNYSNCPEIINSDKDEDYCNDHLLKAIYDGKRMDLATGTFGPLIKPKTDNKHSSCYELINEEKLFTNQLPRTKETKEEEEKIKTIRNSLRSIGNYSSKLLSAASDQLGSSKFKALKNSKIQKYAVKKPNSNTVKNIEKASKKETGLSPLELLKLYHVDTKAKKPKAKKNEEEFELIIE